MTTSTGTQDHPNVFTLPAGVAFLDELVEALYDGRLPGVGGVDDPLALADLTLYLPTRRAARAIRGSFLARSRAGIILPKIRTLGDLDEDEPLSAFDGLDAEDLSRPVMAPLSRQLILTRLVLGWSGAIARQKAGLGDEPSLIPASPADAARLAASLATLLDDVGLAPERWQALGQLAPDDLARYWQITQEFLTIVSDAWPSILSERGLADPGAQRDLLLRAEARRLAERGSKGPVIAAGSTGSVPATAELLAVIARLPNGAVVLPGLDQELDAAGWDAIGDARNDPADAGHPQFGLKKLLESLGCARDAVIPLASAPAGLSRRMRFVSDALRPAATTDIWAETVPAPEALADALDNVALIEAAEEREEALAAALVLRRAVEDGQTAALITPDRALARRVSAMLERWQIRVDDSGGMPLSLTPPGILARLVAEVAWRGAAAIPFLALLKHPLARFGWPAGRVRHAARVLERAVLRGPVLAEGLEPLQRAFQKRRAEWLAKEARSAALNGLEERDWDEAEALLAELLTTLQPMLEVSREAPLSNLLGAHVAALSAIGRDEESGPGELWQDEAGEAMAARLDALTEAAPEGPELFYGDYPALFEALIGDVRVRRRGGNDPRVHIWGALEARLQNVDVAILGGLNEGVWPRPSQSDPFLSRLMAASIGLDPPERRLGLSAHDFYQALGHPQLYLSRALRQGAEPMVPSRWLQRLTARAGESATHALRARGDEILGMTRLLDRPETNISLAAPEPRPPLTARPKRLSVTRIETLIRDPYAIYAQYVLGLDAFEEIASPAGAAERGMLIHDILENFIKERPAGPYDKAAKAHLAEVGREAFAAYEDWPEVAALWWPRFQRIADWFLAQERGRTEVQKRHVEATGDWALSPEFRLTGRADRIDLLNDGRLAIIDYKTGTPPSAKAVLSISPQLPLEALMARRGAFKDTPSGETAELLYYHLSGRGEGGQVHARGFRKPTKSEPGVSLEECLRATEDKLIALIAHFAQADTPYLSNRVPRSDREFGSDYDHLARIGEWSLGEGEE
ncbi:double-strand break repair protein AddB [Afifella aestuarii]|uniref:double-strand break repair protein AddB n=1 Tax=Afifella aestuarii TaxID=1909496 RepID=UPI000FE2A417|nr:double-strand break repair protein AddB [Afifella aestuarii]